MKIIRKPNIINQVCKVCGTEVEITHKEIKRKSWKCPFCSTKNAVSFIVPVDKPTVAAGEPKPTIKRRKHTTVARTSILNNYLKTCPPTIKITDYNKYRVEYLSESAATKLFELIVNGFNTPQRMSKPTGLTESSIVRYCALLKSAKLINGFASTGYHANSNIVYKKTSWKVN